jgi:hypothetical protein
MNDLLDNPAVQAGVAPFLVALVLAVLLRRGALLGLAIGAALATVAALALGFSFDSLTASRKMVLVGLGASVLVLPLELSAIPPRWQLRATLAGAAALAGVWTLWRVLQRMDAGPALWASLAAAAYVAALVESTFAVRDDPVQSASAALILGLATGVLCLFGASATLMQVGIAVGAGAAATLMLQMVSGRRAPVGWTLAWPASVVAGLLGLLSVFTGELNWYCLLPLLGIPWAARLMRDGERPVALSALLTSLAALAPALVAVAFAWFGGAASPP